MRKILISTLSIASVLAYEGCGIDKKEALNALSQSIYVNVSNKLQTQEEFQNGLFSYFNKNIKSESTQSSNVTLSNVKYIHKKNQICAIVSQDEINKNLKTDLQLIQSFNINQLPKNFDEKQKSIINLLNKIKFVKALGNLNKNQLSKINDLEKQLKDLLNKGAVVFDINIPNAKISISSQNKTFSPSNVIELPAGNYSYTISAKGYKDITDEFTINSNKKLTITKTLTSLEELKNVDEKTKYFTKSAELDISYGYAITTDHKPQWDSQKRIEVRYFKNYGIYKFGYGILTGTNTHWTAKDMDELELVITSRIQFPELFDTKFHIGSSALLPYIGIEGGWDIYKFIDEDEKKTNNITNIVRGTIGSTILIHKQFGFNIQYAHDFMEKKDHILSAGIVMDF